MPATPLDSALYRDLLGDREIAGLFTDAAELRAMLLVEGALAEAQAAQGVIPAESAAVIARAAREVQIDAAALASATGRNAVPVPALVAAFREALDAPGHAQYIHWGATSQDIMDTGLMLRLRRVLDILAGRLDETLLALAALADAHAALPMAARTYGQVATPTSFGAVAAGWGRPLIALRTRLDALRPRLLQVSLGGAAGTLAAMGPQGPAVRRAFGEAHGLADPGASWHSERAGITELSGWLTALTAALGRMGEDLVLMTQSGIGEVRLASGGGSSTMPQKANPVEPSLLVALARHSVGLDANLQAAALHRQQRDATAWIVEWLSLPQLSQIAGRALTLAEGVAGGLTPLPERMAGGLDDGLGLIHAEALTFVLAHDMPRPEAQSAVTALCREARETGTPLARLAAARWPSHDWAGLLTAEAQLGTAPQDARAFAAAIRG